MQPLKKERDAGCTSIKVRTEGAMSYLPRTVQFFHRITEPVAAVS
jgi:hypothetical protein